MYSSVQKDIRLGNGGGAIGVGRGGVVNRRARIAGHGKGVTRVAVAGGRLRAGKGTDEEREDNEALKQGEEHGGGSVEQL